MTQRLAPIELGANQPPRPYRGGEGIAHFRGEQQAGAHFPEDFVASTTEIFSGKGVGLTHLADGVALRDAVEADALGYLGPEHVARFGSGTELLVKLLDTAERLFVHVHPNGDFASRHLGLAHGKTEAWIVIGRRDIEGGGHAHIGFRRDVTAEEVDRWVGTQDVPAMLDAMHRVELDVGSTLLVPAGMPHSIGAGLTLVELQEPSDLSVLLEYTGFSGIGADDAFLGLDRGIALGALTRRGLDPSEISDLVGATPDGRTQGALRLLPSSADPYFRADWITVTEQVALDVGFTVLVVVEGEGMLRWGEETSTLRRGMTLLVPHAAAPVRLVGELQVISCRPPAPI